MAALAANAEPLLAADGGANHLGRIGLRPEAVVGDLDSITAGIRAFIGEEHMIQRPDQDRTDLDKTLSYAFDELDLEELTVLGATGGRLDHTVSNLGLLARRALGKKLVFLGADNSIIAVTDEIILEAMPGETLSFFTIDPAVRVSIGGVRWPLQDQPLDLVGRPSISNEAVSEEVTIHAEGGAVIAMRWFGGVLSS